MLKMTLFGVIIEVFGTNKVPYLELPYLEWALYRSSNRTFRIV